MAASKACMALALPILAFLAFLNGAFASDPDILSDFILPSGVSASPEFLTFNGLRHALAGSDVSPGSFKRTSASVKEFPALNGQSVSMVALEFGPGGINTPHSHPRATEMLVVIEGSLMAGLVGSNNKLFTRMLHRGDVFVFPKGMVHFEYNTGKSNKTVAISSFGSSNPGLVNLSETLFASGIGMDVLQESFKADAETIKKLVKANTMG